MLISRNNDWLLGLYQFAIFINCVGLLRPNSYHSALMLLVRCHNYKSKCWRNSDVYNSAFYIKTFRLLEHFKLLTMKFIKRNQFFSENVLKLSYGNVELNKFCGGITPGPPFQSPEGMMGLSPPVTHSWLRPWGEGRVGQEWIWGFSLPRGKILSTPLFNTVKCLCCNVLYNVNSRRTTQAALEPKQ